MDVNGCSPSYFQPFLVVMRIFPRAILFSHIPRSLKSMKIPKHLSGAWHSKKSGKIQWQIDPQNMIIINAGLKSHTISPMVWNVY